MCINFSVILMLHREALRRVPTVSYFLAFLRNLAKERTENFMRGLTFTASNIDIKLHKNYHTILILFPLCYEQ